MKLGSPSVHVHAGDLATTEGSKALVDGAVAAMGGIDLLFLNHVMGM